LRTTARTLPEAAARGADPEPRKCRLRTSKRNFARGKPSPIPRRFLSRRVSTCRAGGADILCISPNPWYRSSMDCCSRTFQDVPLWCGHPGAHGLRRVAACARVELTLLRGTRLLPGAGHYAQGGPGRARPCSCAWGAPGAAGRPRRAFQRKSGGLVRIVVAGCAAGITVQLGGSMLAGAADP